MHFQFLYFCFSFSLPFTVGTGEEGINTVRYLVAFCYGVHIHRVDNLCFCRSASTESEVRRLRPPRCFYADKVTC